MPASPPVPEVPADVAASRPPDPSRVRTKANTMSQPFFHQHYHDVVKPEMIKLRGYTNVHQVPKLEKIVINSGVDAAAEKNVVTDLAKDIGLITGQKPVVTKARKSVANFKLRQGMPIGVKVTLRGRLMYEFLYRLVAIALPTIRDFRGLSGKLDGQGNYNIGITDITIFPEISVETHKSHPGLDIAIVTTAETDDEARELLRLFGMPFRRSESAAKPAA